MIHTYKTERRIFWIGGCLIGIGSIGIGLAFGLRHGASFLTGGVLSAVNMAVLRNIVDSALRRSKISKTRIVAGFFLRLILILLCLYAIIRFLFWGIIAATAGFAAFNCSIFIEGLLEAFKRPG
jgi:hypothetical protein